MAPRTVLARPGPPGPLRAAMTNTTTTRPFRIVRLNRPTDDEALHMIRESVDMLARLLRDYLQDHAREDNDAQAQRE